MVSDGYHYWTMELVGTDDQITFKSKPGCPTGTVQEKSIGNKLT
jgi:hypothetical protein